MRHVMLAAFSLAVACSDPAEREGGIGARWLDDAATTGETSSVDTSVDADAADDAAPSSPPPLGATLDAKGATFRVWAPNAHAAWVAGDFGEVALVKVDDVFEGRVEGVHAGARYRFRLERDGDALRWAVQCEAFDVVECSVNVVDQEALRLAIPAAAAAGVAVIAKRALANAAFAHARKPDRDDVGIYWDRIRAMFPEPPKEPWDDLALRFAAFAPGVDCALVGTTRPEALIRAAEIARRGPLPDARVAELVRAFDARGQGWLGIV